MLGHLASGGLSVAVRIACVIALALAFVGHDPGGGSDRSQHDLSAYALGGVLPTLCAGGADESDHPGVPCPFCRLAAAMLVPERADPPARIGRVQIVALVSHTAEPLRARARDPAAPVRGPPRAV